MMVIPMTDDLRAPREGPEQGETGSVTPQEVVGAPPIVIGPSATADTRTCDFTKVSKETLLAASRQHIADVQAGLAFFGSLLAAISHVHDFDKITDIDGFHRDFATGFKQTEWWDRHRQLNRHHLEMADGVRDDVNLIDVLDYIADCIMAGKARSGSVRPLTVSPEIVYKAFLNTVALLDARVIVRVPTWATQTDSEALR